MIEGSKVLRDKINILVVIKDASKTWGRKSSSVARKFKSSRHVCDRDLHLVILESQNVTNCPRARLPRCLVTHDDTWRSVPNKSLKE